MNSPRTHTARKPLFPQPVWWLTTLAWAATIFFFSTGTYGGSFTAWLLHQALDLLHISVSPENFRVLHHVVRKLAHLSEYAIFCLLIFGSFSGGRDFSWRGRRALAAVAIAAIYSLTDEFHQLFVPGRGPSLVDCGIDTTGASLGMLLIYVRARLGPARASNTKAADASAAEK